MRRSLKNQFTVPFSFCKWILIFFTLPAITLLTPPQMHVEQYATVVEHGADPPRKGSRFRFKSYYMQVGFPVENRMYNMQIHFHAPNMIEEWEKNPSAEYDVYALRWKDERRVGDQILIYRHRLLPIFAAESKWGSVSNAADAVLFATVFLLLSSFLIGLLYAEARASVKRLVAR
jgi:hypothetical protein